MVNQDYLNLTLSAKLYKDLSAVKLKKKINKFSILTNIGGTLLPRATSYTLCSHPKGKNKSFAIFPYRTLALW